jgi:uncharacterized DUF497 family protein
MDVVFRFQGTEFEWDANKAYSNFDKHGVSFQEAIEIFFDPFYLAGDASREGEERQFVIGYSLTQRLLLTVFTERATRTRIISARPATRTERRFYEDRR